MKAVGQPYDYRDPMRRPFRNRIGNAIGASTLNYRGIQLTFTAKRTPVGGQ